MKKKLKIFLYKTVLNIKNIKEKDTLVIFSDQRHGSTWLMELLSKNINNCLINWESLQEDNRITPDRFNFSWKPILAIEYENKEIINFFKKLHKFKYVNSWTVSQNRFSDVLKGKFVITKYVKANLLVPFLFNSINFINKPIFLLRHPIDVCISQINHFSKNDETLKNIKEVNIFISKYFSHIKLFDEKQKFNKLELQIINWCINNCYTIDRIKDLNIEVVFYSDLLMNPKLEIDKILKTVDSEYVMRNTQATKFNNYLRKPSFTIDKEHFKSDPKKQLTKNIEKLDEKTKDRIQNIFDHFSFKLYTAYSSDPYKGILLKS